MKVSTLDANAAATPKQPNFIVFYGEGAGWVSTSVQMDERNPASKGTTNKTPNLERLAATGMRFSDGYAPSPRCTPSRATILTGRSPAALHMTFVGFGDGMGGNVNTRVIPVNASTELPLEETTIAELLKGVGYATAHFGKWHLGRVDPSKHGFDAIDLTHDELAKEHIRHMVGGHSMLAQEERLLRFEFPERPGALMRFLLAMRPGWNISLFHYRNQGADYGRILMGLQVPAKDGKAFAKFLEELGYPYVEETLNPAYRLFLQR